MRDVKEVLRAARLSVAQLEGAGIKYGSIQLGVDWSEADLDALAEAALAVGMRWDRRSQYSGKECVDVIDAVDLHVGRSYYSISISAQGVRPAREGETTAVRTATAVVDQGAAS